MLDTEVEEYLRSRRPLFRNGFRHEVSQRVWPRHNHSELELVYFTQGRGSVAFPDGTALEFEPGGVILIPPGLPHQTSFETVPSETAAILVELPGPFPAAFGRATWFPPVKDSQRVADIMCLTAPPPDMGALARLEFDFRCAALLARLARSSGQPEAALDQAAQYVAMAHDYLQRHFARIGGLEEVADHVGVGYEHLRHLFKERRGMSLKQFLTNLRINHAKQLLLTSRMQIKEIAAACGFEGERHFSMYFKDCEGTPPSDYRKRHQELYLDGFAAKPRRAPAGSGPTSKCPPECQGIKGTPPETPKS